MDMDDCGFVDPMTMPAYRKAVEAEAKRIADAIDAEVLEAKEVP
jgi:hypothetical protein